MIGIPGASTTLILGGARSGKSAFAESVAEATGLEKVYVATGEAHDAEMSERIAQHKALRRGKGWITIEEPLDIAAVIEGRSASNRVLLVDCLTLWLTNLMAANRVIDGECSTLCSVLAATPGPVIFVSNEIGMGIVPDNAMAREFRDHAGRLHQQIATVCGQVYLVAAGLPLKLKG